MKFIEKFKIQIYDYGEFRWDPKISRSFTIVADQKLEYDLRRARIISLTSLSPATVLIAAIRGFIGVASLMDWKLTADRSWCRKLNSNIRLINQIPICNANSNSPNQVVNF